METELWTQVTQFGAAGLMAWMWLSERRAALTRERELTEAHARVMEQRVHVDALLQAVKEGARTAAALEAGQRAIGAAVDRIADAILGARGRAGASSHAVLHQFGAQPPAPPPPAPAHIHTPQPGTLSA